MGLMRPRTEAPTGPRAGGGARRRGRGAIAAAVAATVALASLAVAASAPAGSAAGPAAVEAPAAGSILGGGPGGILGVGPELGARDPGRPLRGAAPVRASVGGSSGRWFERGRHGSRGHGFVRDAR